jgi:hypothetical protein
MMFGNLEKNCGIGLHTDWLEGFITVFCLQRTTMTRDATLTDRTPVNLNATTSSTDVLVT